MEMCGNEVGDIKIGVRLFECALLRGFDFQPGCSYAENKPVSKMTKGNQVEYAQNQMNLTV